MLLPLFFFLLLGFVPSHEPGHLFEEVVQVLEEHYYDRTFSRDELPELIAAYRPLAEEATSLKMEREVIHRFLEGIPASHLALYSEAAFERIKNELANRKSPTFGFQLVEHEENYFVHTVFAGGPADEAGLLRWDRVVEIDGEATGKSERLDWRTDDACLPDPPVHPILCKSKDRVTLLVERRPGERFEFEIKAKRYSTFDAAKASCRVIPHQGKQYGYVRFWYIHHTGPAELLTKKFKGAFKDCDGLILDLRGRGGNAGTIGEMLSAIKKGWHPRPMVALVDTGTRSAKEILTYEIKERWMGLIVGERTAGAVIPATFKRVGSDSILMFPSFTLGRYTDLLEGVGVEPDFSVRDATPYSAGADPILEKGLDVLARGIRRM
jgi:carboxyl-terminal processing protease